MRQRIPLAHAVGVNAPPPATFVSTHSLTEMPQRKRKRRRKRQPFLAGSSRNANKCAPHTAGYVRRVREGHAAFHGTPVATNTPADNAYSSGVKVGKQKVGKGRMLSVVCSPQAGSPAPSAKMA